MEDNKDLDDLLQRFFNNTATAEESALVRQWLRQLDITDQTVPAQQMAAIKSAMYERITSIPSIRHHRQQGILRRIVNPWVAAASIILVLGIGATIFLNRSTPNATAVAGLIREVNSGTSVRHVRLKDGTEVWLNMYSTLTYAADFSNRDRAVRLEGEGYFEVAQDSRRPFTVTTGNIETRVLGTAFNIESYPDESETRVALVQGKVRVGDDLRPNEQLILTADETMRYNRTTRSWEQMRLDLAHVKDWTTGSIVFNEVPLAEALNRIARRYHLHLQFSPETVAGKRITTVLKSAPWQSVLSDILFVHHLEYTESNDVISIKQ